MAPKRQKVVSVIWDYFSVNAQNEIKAKCNQCNVSVPRGGPGSQKTSWGTKSLWKHLEVHH